MSCYLDLGLGFGFKNVVLFTSLVFIIPRQHVSILTYCAFYKTGRLTDDNFEIKQENHFQCDKCLQNTICVACSGAPTLCPAPDLTLTSVFELQMKKNLNAERRRRENRGAEGAEGCGVWGGGVPLPTGGGVWGGAMHLPQKNF